MADLEDRKSELQSKADEVYALHNRRAPAPEYGERLDRYDARLVRPLQQHSPAFSKLDYGSLPEAARVPVRQQIFKDARHAADNPVVPEGELKEIRRRDSSGRVISTFAGSPSAWLNEFKLDKQLAKIRDPRK
jgi:hypothetical protein